MFLFALVGLAFLNCLWNLSTIQSQISGAQKSFNATTKARDIERIIQSAKGESGMGGMWKGQGIGGGGMGKSDGW